VNARTEQALELMARFAERTGLTSQRTLRRYLWTDAFAVCNFLGLDRATGDSRHGEIALQLVDGVHHVLGRHRTDDPRRGWISGLDDEQGKAHPTRGGLRIGKPLPERRPDEPIDERLEWDRDGQYFHYLTKWMHALDQVARSTGQPLFGAWARELAHAAHRAFTYAPGDGSSKRMYWKLSIDLSRPLVASMGQHDPLDGVVTYVQLEAGGGEGPSLRDAIGDFTAMIEPRSLATADPLGIGGLLVDAYRIVQLEQQGVPSFGLLETVLEAARVGLRHYVNRADLRWPAPRRLAFRELGLAIGLAAVARMDAWAATSADVRASIAHLARYGALRDEIEAFWLRSEHRGVDSWLEHADINDVMLATTLAPEGFLVLRTRRPRR
jgi:hypothetical protein